MTSLSETSMLAGSSGVTSGYTINQSIRFNEPHHLANYLYDICNLFNIFYQQENILSLKDEEMKESKLLLTKYFLDTIKLTFNCLGIEPVEKM